MLLSSADQVPARCRRVLVSGCSGSGKSTVARQLSARLDLPYQEIDALFHGPGWTVRPEFVDDVTATVARENWVVEYQYSQVRPLLLERADLFVWLDLPRWRVSPQPRDHRLAGAPPHHVNTLSAGRDLITPGDCAHRSW